MKLPDVYNLHRFLLLENVLTLRYMSCLHCNASRRHERKRYIQHCFMHFCYRQSISFVSTQAILCYNPVANMLASHNESNYTAFDYCLPSHFSKALWFTCKLRCEAPTNVLTNSANIFFEMYLPRSSLRLS